MKTTRSNHAFALVLVLTLAFGLGITAAVLLRYAGTEARLNQRNQLRFQAKNAAEAMLEYGASELMKRLESNVNFSTGELRGTPLTIHGTRKATLFTQAAGSYNDVNPSSLLFWASQYTESVRRYVDPNDPGNAYDPLRGQNVRTQTLRLLSSATAATTNLTESQYATQSIEIRDVYLFNYAIFYNLPMEFHPGANMTISGPVHSNVGSYFTTNAVLTFMNPVTVAGNFIVGSLEPNRPTGRNIRLATGLDINNDGVADTIQVDDSSIRTASNQALGTYVDSLLSTRSTGNRFDQIASQVWRGNVQDSSMGIIAQNLPGIQTASSAQAHTLIEPPDTSGSSNANVEAQKYSNKAGLYIFQAANSGAAPPSAVAFATSTDAATYKAQATAAARTAWLAANPTKEVKLPSNLVRANRRLYDAREGSWVSTVDIDVGKLRTAVNTTTANAATNLKVWDVSTAANVDWNLEGSTGWNGRVYVEVERPTLGFVTASDVASMPAGTPTRTSVRLMNGSQLPNRREVNMANSLLPDGFTIATNAPVYICGNYNSPGADAGTRSGTGVGTETAATIGLPKDNESPAAIAADAINILSNNWLTGTVPTGDTTTSTASAPAATKTEVAAAFLTGNVPTPANGSSYSGGVENFPRFHENWGNIRFRYRGSMVALFNSTVATGGWASARYSPPTREWGFSQMFQQGRQPPGTPMLRTFRRVTYGDLTTAQFNALRGDATLGFTSM